MEGAVLRYLIRGRGLPALVVGSSIYYPRTFSEGIDDALQLHFVDARHFAHQVGPVDPARPVLERYIMDIETARDYLGLQRVVLIGHSHHGNLACAYARRFPDRVSHLVLIGSPPGNVETTVRAAEGYWEGHASHRRKAMLHRRRKALHSATSAPPPSYVAQYVADAPKYWYRPDYDAAHLWDGVPVHLPEIERFRGCFTGAYSLVGKGLPQGVSMLVVMGRHDYAVPHVLWEQLLPMLDGRLSYELFARSGHTPQLEQARRFEDVLLAWLRRQP